MHHTIIVLYSKPRFLFKAHNLCCFLYPIKIYVQTQRFRFDVMLYSCLVTLIQEEESGKVLKSG